MKKVKIAVAGTGYVGLSIATLLAQKNSVIAVDIIPERVKMINEKKSPIKDEYIEKYLEEKELDLVMISPTAVPPVCKIMDLGKYIYEQSKKEKEAKKKQKVTVIKEIRCSLTIEENDIAIKAKNARKFLLDGDKVKVTVRFKGREATLGHLGLKILENFVSKLEDVCTVEKAAKQEGRNMTMVLAPKKA